MATVQAGLGYGGIKKQSAKGSVAATPAIVGFGISAGQIANNPITSDYEDITLPGGTTSDMAAASTNRTQVLPGASFTCPAMPNSLASFVLAALGTDSSSSLVHTETPALALPYFGLMGKFGAAPEVTRLNDAKCDTFKLSVDETNPVVLDMTWMGTTITPDFTFTATNDDSVIQEFNPFGSTLQFDLDGSTLATEPVSSFSVEINNNLSPVWLASAITPNDIIEGRKRVEGTLTVKPINLDGWQNVLTGSTGGTTAQGAPLFGSFAFTITNGTQSIVMSAPRVEFLCDYPAFDVSGAPATLDFAYKCVRPTDGSAMFTAVVTNTLSGSIT